MTLHHHDFILFLSFFTHSCVSFFSPPFSFLPFFQQTFLSPFLLLSKVFAFRNSSFSHIYISSFLTSHLNLNPACNSVCSLSLSYIPWIPRGSRAAALASSLPLEPLFSTPNEMPSVVGANNSSYLQLAPRRTQHPHTRASKHTGQLPSKLFIPHGEG